MRKLSIKCMTSITMMKLKKKNIFIILMSVFILMTATPDILVPAASAGIRLWGLKVVPGLIMGLIFVGCLDYYMPQSSAYGTFLVILCSLLCGFPTGALNCIQYSRRHNNNSFIADIMPYCNTSSPGFTINYIYYGLLSDYINIRAFLICTYMPVILLILCEWFKKRINTSRDIKHINMSKNKQHLTIPQNNKKNSDYQKQSHTTPTNMNFSDILNNSIGKTACSILKLGGYIIIFSCISAYIECFAYNSPTAGVLLCGVLEITNGMYMAAGLQLSSYIKVIIILIINAFGGISTLMQTCGIIKDNLGYSIDTRQYIKSKLKLVLCTLLVTYITRKCGLI